MSKRMFFVFFISLSQLLSAQTVIEMTPFNGVYKINCKINGVPMDFIFDTGATNVSISSTEALFLVKQGLITDEDILGTTTYQTANGQIIEGTKINIDSIEIGGLQIKNVVASVVHELNAPLLLGQSALEKLGPIKINGNKLTITSQKNPKYKSEIMKGVEFVNDFFKTHQIEDDTIHIEYSFLELRETVMSGYSIWGLKKNFFDDKKTSAFVIDIANIVEIKFGNIHNGNNDEFDILVLVADPETNGFVYTDSQENAFYKTWLYGFRVCCTTPKIRDRVLKAFKHIIEKNQLFIEKTQKF